MCKQFIYFIIAFFLTLCPPSPDKNHKSLVPTRKLPITPELNARGKWKCVKHLGDAHFRSLALVIPSLILSETHHSIPENQKAYTILVPNKKKKSHPKWFRGTYTTYLTHLRYDLLVCLPNLYRSTQHTWDITYALYKFLVQVLAESSMINAVKYVESTRRK